MNTQTATIPEMIVSLTGVTLGYPGVIALSDLNFEVRKGEFVGIVGPNGSGKSTLLKGILGLIPVYSGQILFGREIPGSGKQTNHRLLRQARREIGYVPQKSKNDLAFPALAIEVVLMGLYSQIGWFHRPKREHWAKAEESLDMVGMAEFRDRPIRELSGGQQQRVMIARSLVADPQLLILDEPTAAVDIYAQRSILKTLETLNKEKGITILMVSHDINEIVHFCDKTLLINGSTSFFGTPNEVLTKDILKKVYGERIYLHDHHGHPHVLVGDFDE